MPCTMNYTLKAIQTMIGVNPSSGWLASAVVALTLAVGGTLAHAAETFPYTADFSQPETSSFNFNNETPWSIDNDALNLVVRRQPGEQDMFRAEVEVDVPPQTDFVYSSSIRINAIDTEGRTTLGLRFLGEQPLIDSGGRGGYAAELQQDGTLRLIKWFDGSLVDVIATADLGAAMAADTSYAFTVEVSYRDAGGVDIDFTVDNGTNSQTISYFDAVDIPAGSYFGYRHREFGYDLDVSMNSFTIVPEPASLGLLGASGALMLLRRRG